MKLVMLEKRVKQLEESLARSHRRREFIVEDAAGKVRARLGVDDRNNVALELWDAEGKLRVNLSVEGGGVFLSLLDHNNIASASILVTPDCGPSLFTTDEYGQARFLVTPSLGLFLSDSSARCFGYITPMGAKFDDKEAGEWASPSLEGEFGEEWDYYEP